MAAQLECMLSRAQQHSGLRWDTCTLVNRRALRRNICLRSSVALDGILMAAPHSTRPKQTNHSNGAQGKGSEQGRRLSKLTPCGGPLEDRALHLLTVLSLPVVEHRLHAVRPPVLNVHRAQVGEPLRPRHEEHRTGQRRDCGEPDLCDDHASPAGGALALSWVRPAPERAGLAQEGGGGGEGIFFEDLNPWAPPPPPPPPPLDL